MTQVTIGKTTYKIVKEQSVNELSHGPIRKHMTEDGDLAFLTVIADMPRDKGHYNGIRRADGSIKVWR